MLTERQIKANLHTIRFSLQLEKWVKEQLWPDFTVRTKVDWSTARRSSRGGIYKDGPGINIAMQQAVPDNGNVSVYRFYEYPSFDSDHVIGGFYSTNPYHKLEAVIAHEVAHAVQFYSYTKTGTRCKPHGTVFKQYYSMLRKQFVNSQLPDQAPLEKVYADYLKQIKLWHSRVI